jgi:hypothetical protein
MLSSTHCSPKKEEIPGQRYRAIEQDPDANLLETVEALALGGSSTALPTIMTFCYTPGLSGAQRRPSHLNS